MSKRRDFKFKSFSSEFPGTVDGKIHYSFQNAVVWPRVHSICQRSPIHYLNVAGMLCYAKLNIRLLNRVSGCGASNQVILKNLISDQWLQDPERTNGDPRPDTRGVVVFKTVDPLGKAILIMVILACATLTLHFTGQKQSFLKRIDARELTTAPTLPKYQSELGSMLAVNSLKRIKNRQLHLHDSMKTASNVHCGL